MHDNGMYMQFIVRKIRFSELYYCSFLLNNFIIYTHKNPTLPSVARRIFKIIIIRKTPVTTYPYLYISRGSNHIIITYNIILKII